MQVGNLQTIKCADCGFDITQLNERDGGKPFLILPATGADFRCGPCTLKMLTPKQCVCGILYKGIPKFCQNCGVRLNE